MLLAAATAAVDAAFAVVLLTLENYQALATFDQAWLAACIAASVCNLGLAAYTLAQLAASKTHSDPNFVPFAVTEQALLLACCAFLGGAALLSSPMQTRLAMSGDGAEMPPRVDGRGRGTLSISAQAPAS